MCHYYHSLQLLELTGSLSPITEWGVGMFGKCLFIFWGGSCGLWHKQKPGETVQAMIFKGQTR